MTNEADGGEQATGAGCGAGGEAELGGEWVACWAAVGRMRAAVNSHPISYRTGFDMSTLRDNREKLRTNIELIGDLAKSANDFDTRDSALVGYASHVHAIVAAYQRLKDCSLDDATENVLSDMNEAAEFSWSNLALFIDVKDKKRSGANIPAGDAISGIRSAYAKTFSTVVPYVAYCEKTSAYGAEEVSRAIETLSDKNKAADSMIDAMREATGEAGIGKYQAVFSTQAGKHVTSGAIWLSVTVVVVVAMGVYAIVLFNTLPSTPKDALLYVVPNVIFLTVLYFVLIWCSRMHRAHAHNATVNRHRQNALTTFAAFAEATKDEQAKAAILLQAAQCVFSPQPTGFSPGKQSDSAATPPILEIFRSTMKGS